MAANRNIVFVGNCHAEALSRVYRNHFCDPMSENVIRIDASRNLEMAGREALAEADLIALQEIDFASKIDLGRVRAGTKIVRFPLVMCGFLWPFAGRPHPKNRQYRYFGPGPFNPPMGDSYLNRLISRGIGAAEAVNRYLSLDFNKVTSLDRLYELALTNQRKREAKTGMSAADAIERHFRQESLFQDFGHFRLRIFRTLAHQLYAAMGITETEIERVLAGLVTPPFPILEAPIHPAVGQHFGLTYATEQTLYQFALSGPVTFEEYVRRYMSYDWDEELHEGIWLSRGSEPDRAVALIDAGLRRSPKSSAGHRARSMVLLQLGRKPEALAAARISAELDPDNPDSLLFLARIEVETGDAANAVLRATRLTQAYPSYGQAHHILAYVHLQAGQIDEAIQSAHRAVHTWPGDPLCHNRLGQVLLAKQDFPAAEKALRAAVALGLATPATFAALVRAIGGQERFEEAIEQAIAGLAKAPDSRTLLNLLNGYLRQIVAQKGDLSRAQALVRAAIALTPQFADLHRTLADILVRRKEDAEAEKAYRGAIELDPGHAPDHVQLCLILVRIGHLSAATEAAKRASELAPSLPSAYFALSQALGGQGRFEEAIEQAIAGLAKAPNSRTLLNLLNCYLRQFVARKGDLSRAQALVGAAIVMAPQYADLHRTLADILVRRKQDAEAEKAYRGAIEFDPGHAPDHVQLCLILVRIGQLSAATEAAERASELAPSLPSAYFALSQALGRQGRFDEAANAVRGWVALQPNNPRAHLQLGNFELHRGQVEAARCAFARAVEIQPENAVLRRALAIALDRSGHIEEAIVEARRVVALDPADISNTKHLNSLLLKLARRVFWWASRLVLRGGRLGVDRDY